MSFYSTMHYARRGPAPDITGHTLAAFVRHFASLGITDDHFLSAKVRCGGPIDFSSENGLHEAIVHPDTPTITTLRDLPCEIDEHRIASLSALADLVAELGPRTIYRACVSLGSAPDELMRRVGRPFPENTSSFRPDSWSLEIGPVYEHSLDDECDEEEPPLGWVSLALSGYGYFWPRTADDLRREIEAEPAAQAAMRCCARHWPSDWAWLGAETG
jgi:hypothetical protein